MSAFRHKIDSDGVAIITFDTDTEKVNKFTLPIMEELDTLLSEIKDNAGIKGLIINSGKKEHFIVGADISEIRKITDSATGERLALRGQSIFEKLETVPYPTVAAIHGSCLGGGLELALACSYRIVSNDSKTVLSLPEIKLGVIPGFGGTQRLPKLIGIRNAMDLILSGRFIYPNEAKNIGLVDDVVSEELLISTSKALILKATGKTNAERIPKRFYSPYRLLEKTYPWRKLLYRITKKKVLAKTRGNYPAPLFAMTAIYAGINKGVKEGYLTEARLFGELSATNISKNLISLFYIKKDMESNQAMEDEDKTLKIRSAGIIGAGVIGAGISQLLAEKKIPVFIKIKDNNSKAANSELTLVKEIFERKAQKGLLSDIEVKEGMERITLCTDYSRFGDIDIVIEAAVEDMDVKKAELAKFEQVAKEEAIFATTTSSLSISELAGISGKKSHVVGMHFFNPVDKMPLVEIVKGENTDSSTVATLVKLAKRLGKIPVVVNDYPGFLVNRILAAYLCEAVKFFEEGQDIEWIDSVLVDFGMPIGAFALLDLIGIDIVLKVGRMLFLEDEEKSFKILDIMQNGGYLGKKVGKGFYNYNKKGIQRGISKYDHKSNVKRAKSQLSKSEIEDRMMLIMLKEAAFCLEKNIINRAEYLDAALIFGLGFPSFRGGLLRYADTLGIDTVEKKMNFLTNKYGNRFNLPKLIKHDKVLGIYRYTVRDDRN